QHEAERLLKGVSGDSSAAFRVTSAPVGGMGARVEDRSARPPHTPEEIHVMRRLLLPLLGLAAACALLAACGGEEGGAGAAVPSVQDESTATSDAGTGTAGEGTGTDEDVSPKERQEAMLAYARCMRKNGVDMEDPKPGEGLALRVRKGEERKMEKAQKACQP